MGSFDLHSDLDSLEQYKNEGIRGVWLRIPTTKARFIPEAIEMQFTFHHAEPDYAMLTQVC